MFLKISLEEQWIKYIYLKQCTYYSNQVLKKEEKERKKIEVGSTIVWAVFTAAKSGQVVNIFPQKIRPA